LKLPNSVKKAAQRLAKEDGVSLNQWIAAAVAQKVGVMETAADFFKERAGKAKGDGLMKFLRNAPRVAPNLKTNSANRAARVIACPTPLSFRAKRGICFFFDSLLATRHFLFPGLYERAKRRMAHPFQKQTRKGGAPSAVKLRVLHPPYRDER
jgi:hypothetical protein